MVSFQLSLEAARFGQSHEKKSITGAKIRESCFGI